MSDTDTQPNPFNADLARRALAAIEADPAHWNQYAWISKTDCGTAYCFAGWAVRLHDGADPDYDTAIDRKAEDALGLDPWIAGPLFAPDRDLADLRAIVADYADAGNMGQLEATALQWGAGAYADYYDGGRDDDDWYDE